MQATARRLSVVSATSCARRRLIRDVAQEAEFWPVKPMMLADADFPIHELLEVAQRARSHIHALEGVLIWMAVPLALLPPIPIAWRWIWIRTFVITVVIWISLLGFRIAYEVPWNRTVLDIEKRDWGYDGVGGNAALLMLGWLFPFLQCLITLCLTRLVLSRFGSRKTPTATIACIDTPPAAAPGEQGAAHNRMG